MKGMSAFLRGLFVIVLLFEWGLIAVTIPPDLYRSRLYQVEELEVSTLTGWAGERALVVEAAAARTASAMTGLLEDTPWDPFGDPGTAAAGLLELGADIPSVAADRAATNRKVTNMWLTAAETEWVQTLALAGCLVLKRLSLLFAATLLAGFPLIALAADGVLERRIRAAGMLAPRPVLFNAAAIATGSLAAAVVLVLPLPGPLPLGFYGAVPFTGGMLLRVLAASWHRYG